MIAGAEGDFEFTNVALAPFRLDARAPGHHMVPAPLWEFGTEPRLDNVRIVLAQSRQVFGFVFDPDGNPMQGAQAKAESRKEATWVTSIKTRCSSFPSRLQ